MTSNESLIYGKLLTEHPNFIKPITELSYNEAQAHNFIMSNEMGFDFDMVHNCSTCYSKVRNEKSPDAIFLNEDTLYFIEFKDGKNVDKHDIRLKIHEAALTLFMLAKKHLPTITRDDFFKLKINYAVFIRSPKDQVSFANALTQLHEKYTLKNIEGYIINQTRVTFDPQTIVDFLHKVTQGKVKEISVFEHMGKTGITDKFTAQVP